MRARLVFVLMTGISMACAARTEIADDEDDLDASSPDAAQDVTVIDVTPPPPPDDATPPPDDATPPPPPPIDAAPPPPPDDAAPPPPPIDAAPPPPPDDAGPPPIDAGPPPTTCPDPCHSNHECEHQCSPPLESGRYCCDKQTETCFAYAGFLCPAEIPDASLD